MGNSGYLKFILTLLTAAVVLFGYLAVNAVDRMRITNLKLIEKLEAMPRYSALVALPAAPEVSGAPAANAEFFDRSAPFGGRMISAIQADTGNMNVIINNEATASIFNSLCNSPLAAANYANPGEYQSMLAESWEVSPDHKSFRIKLRRGVMWHDFTDPVTGREFHDVELTAADFKFFVDVVKNPEVNCEPLRIYYQDLESLEIINDYEFTVNWRKPYYGALTSTLTMSPLPRHLYDYGDGGFDGAKFNDDHLRNRMIVGCGPYMFVRWDKDKRVLFRRNPRYFGIPLGVGPRLETLAFDIIKHPNTQFLALLGGTVDRLNLTPEQWVTRTGEPQFKDGRIKLHKYLSPGYSYIGWNLRNELFADARVRRALTMLIDREKIRHDVFYDLAEIATGPFLLNSAYNDPEIRPLPYDPAAAGALLAEAGWRDTDNDGILERDGRKFSFTMMQIATSPIQQKMMPIIKENLAAAGIDMKLQNVEWSVYTQRLESRTFEACSLGWTTPYDPDPYQVWHSSQADSAGSSNFISFRNARADGIIEELRETFDMPRRIELAREFCRILHEEQPYTFLFCPYSLSAIDGRYRNTRVFPMGMPEDIMWVPEAEQRAVADL